VPVHEHSRQGAHHDLVALAQGGQQQLGQGRVIQGAKASATTVAVLAAQPALTTLTVLAGLRRPGVARTRRDLRGLGGEVQVEDSVEGELVVVRLDQDRAQRGLHRGAVTDRQVPQAVHRVDPLGERDRDADLAQLGDHAFYGGEHGPAFLGVSATEAATTAATTGTATIITRLTREADGPG
jgi:hypothetical protein